MQLAASQHGKVIEPLLSLSVDFYIRVFVRVWSSPISVKAIAAKHGICYICRGCLVSNISTTINIPFRPNLVLLLIITV